VLRSQMVDGYLGYGMESESFNSNAEESDWTILCMGVADSDLYSLEGHSGCQEETPLWGISLWVIS
jgi:hypothetical protein